MGLSSTRLPPCYAPKSEHLALFLGVGEEKKRRWGNIFSPPGNETWRRGPKRTHRSLWRWLGSGVSSPQGAWAQRGNPGSEKMVFHFSLVRVSVHLCGEHQHIFAAEQIASFAVNGLPWVGRKYFLMKAPAFLFLLGCW